MKYFREKIRTLTKCNYIHVCIGKVPALVEGINAQVMKIGFDEDLGFDG